MDIGDKIFCAICASPLVFLLWAWILSRRSNSNDNDDGSSNDDDDNDDGDKIIIIVHEADLPKPDYSKYSLGAICNEIREDEKKRQRELDERRARRARSRGQDWWF